MAKATLPTNYKDDVLASSMGGKRRFRKIENSDGIRGHFRHNKYLFFIKIFISKMVSHHFEN